MHFFSFVFAFYVDPGSGSMVLQLILGGASGVYVVFRLFKQRIFKLLGIASETSSTTASPPAIAGQSQEAKPVKRIA